MAVASPRSLLGKTLNVLSLCSVHTVTEINTEHLELPMIFFPPPSPALRVNCASYSSFILVLLFFTLQS